MNKQEFQQKIKDMKYKKDCVYMSSFEVYLKGFEKAKELALLYSNSLDELEKPVIPKYVADWIEWCKKNKVTLLGAIIAVCNDKNIRTLDASGWAWKNQETFAKAWFYGYEVEKEKLYRAKNRHTGEYLCYCFNFYHDKNSSSENQRFTAEEKRWKELGYWDNDLYVFEEAKGEDV